MGYKVSMAELTNRVVLQNPITNADALAESIVVWGFEAEKRIGTGNMFDHQDKLYTVSDTKFRIPDNVDSIEDICIPGHSIIFSNGSLKRGCNCSCDDCCCITVAKNGKYLNFSKEVASVWLDYTGIAVDELGFPMIDEDHVDAITAYITFMLISIRFNEGKVSHAVYKENKRTYMAKFLAANSRDKMPNAATRRRLDAIFNSKLPIDYTHYCDYVKSCCGTGPAIASSGSSGSGSGSGGGVSIVNNITNVNNTTINTGNWDVVVVTGDGTDEYTNSAFIGLDFNSDIFVYYDGTTLQLGTDVLAFDNTTGKITYAATISVGKIYRIFYRIT